MGIIKSQYLSILVLGVIIFSIFILERILEIDIDIWVVISFILFIAQIAYTSPNFIIRYIMIFFMCISNLIGVYICEHYILKLSELATTSSFSGSFPLITLGWFIFLVVLYYLDDNYPLNTLQKKIPIFKVTYGKVEFTVKNTIPIVFLILSFLLLFRGFTHPYYLEGIDRFIYHELYLQGVWRLIYSVALICIPIILFIFYKKRSILLLISLSIYAIFLFLAGEKFGAFWNMIVVGCIVYSIYNQDTDKKNSYKILRYIFLSFLCLIILLIGHRGLNQNTPLSDDLDYLIIRTAQQGQLWWSTYTIEKNQDYKLNELNDEFQTYFTLDDEGKASYNYAIYKIMRLTTPQDIVENKIKDNSRYASSTFATIYYYFKEVGIVIYAVIGALCFWLVMKAFMYSLLNLYLIETYISSRLLFDSYAALTQSEFNLIFSFKYLFYLVIFLSLYLIRLHFYSKKAKYSHRMFR